MARQFVLAVSFCKQQDNIDNIRMTSMQELLKENSLLKEYIITLQKQVKANADQRDALFKQMTNINHENVQLNRRISTQPTPAVTAALQHYQQMFKEESHKNASITQELMLVKAEKEQLVNNSTINHRRIEELENSLLKLKEQAEGMNKLEGQAGELRRRLKSHEDTSVALDVLRGQIQKERQFAHKIKEEKEELESQMAHLRIESQRIHHQSQYLQQNLSKLRTEFDQMRQKQQQMAAKLALLNTNLAQSITSNQQLEDQNQSLRQSLQIAKKQIQDLSMEIRQYVNQKVQHKMRKNRTENCGIKAHFQFDNAFQQLKVQIEAIKNDKNQQDSPQYEAQTKAPTYKSKLNAGFDLSSTSKWHTIEGKLSLLRSTQSMSRFR